MSVGLWVWWVSIEESVDMVSLDALLIFFSHLPSSPRFHSQGMIFSIHISAWPEWNYIQNISPRRVRAMSEK